MPGPPSPHQVTSVNGKRGDVRLTASDVGSIDASELSANVKGVRVGNGPGKNDRAATAVDFPNIPASKVTSGIFLPDRLGTGAGGQGLKTLYDDGVWRTPGGVQNPFNFTGSGFTAALVNFIPSIGNFGVGTGPAFGGGFAGYGIVWCPGGTFSTLTCLQTSGAVAGTAQLGLYAMDCSLGNGMPGTLIALGSTFTNNANGLKTSTFGPIDMIAGWYWVVYMSNSASTVGFCGAQFHLVGSLITAANNSLYASAPANPLSPQQLQNPLPLAYCKVSGGNVTTRVGFADWICFALS